MDATLLLVTLIVAAFGAVIGFGLVASLRR